MFAFGKPNFRLSGQKLFLDFKNPFKIVASAEPEPRTRTSSVWDTLREGEATIAQNPNFEKWRYLLDKIRTFFDENPDCEFWKFRSGGAGRKGGTGERNARPALAFSPPQFFVFRFAKCTANKKKCCPCPTRPYAGNGFTPAIIITYFGLYHNRIYNTSSYVKVNLFQRIQKYYWTA